MSDDSGEMPTADEAAQQEADKIDHALEQLQDVQETIAEIAADFEERHDELTADEPTLPLPRGIISIPLGHVASAPPVQDEEIDEAPAIESPMPQTAVPFPHDPEALHAIDGLARGGTVTKTSRFGYSLQDANGRKIDGYPIAKMGDALEHLPVGTTIEVSENDQVVLMLPATATRALVATVGHNLHYAVHQVWPWLVTEGHAKVAP